MRKSLEALPNPCQFVATHDIIRYHNTLKLLQNYRDVNWSLEVSAQNLQSEFRAEYGGTSADYVDDLTINGDKNAAARIEGLTLSLDKSRRMMELVNSAINLMREKHKKGELYYWILYYTYMYPQEPDTVNEVLTLLEKHFPPMSIRTYYSKREEAVQILSSILWGYTSTEYQELIRSFFTDKQPS